MKSGAAHGRRCKWASATDTHTHTMLVFGRADGDRTSGVLSDALTAWPNSQPLTAFRACALTRSSLRGASLRKNRAARRAPLQIMDTLANYQCCQYLGTLFFASPHCFPLPQISCACDELWTHGTRVLINAPLSRPSAVKPKMCGVV